MGTVWEMVVWASDRERALRMVDGAFEAVARLERLMSRFLTASQVNALARAAGQAAVPVDPDLYTPLAIAQEIAAMSRGAFDVTMGPLMTLWSDAAARGTLPSPEQLQAARSLVDYRALTMDARGPTATLGRVGMSLDLGAIGKGFAVDRAVEQLQAAGYTQGWVNAGGNVRMLGAWNRGVPARDPRNPDRAFLRLTVKGGEALSTSANYERSWQIGGQSYGHLLDPRTGRPADSGCVSVTVCAPTAALADALSTACFVLGPERSQPVCAMFPEVETLWCVRGDRDQMQLVMTPGLDGRVHDLSALQEEPIDADVSLA